MVEIHFNDHSIPDDYFKKQLRVRKDAFEVILNHLNPHLTRQNTAMHDYIPPVLAFGKCLLFDFIDSAMETLTYQLALRLTLAKAP